MPDAIVGGEVGIQQSGDGPGLPLRLDRQAALVVSELNGRFAELAYRGQLYSGGMTLTSISNATFTSATTGATATPIAGLWNPLNSGVNAFILQAQLGVTITALQATGGGPYVWMVGTASNAVTLGAVPFSMKTLLAAGSVLKNMAGAALTGLTGALSIVRASSLGGGSSSNVAFLATQVAMQTQQVSAVENLDGSIMVPPGGVLALMATTTPVAHSAASGLLWAELPV